MQGKVFKETHRCPSSSVLLLRERDYVVPVEPPTFDRDDKELSGPRDEAGRP
jgi:hypothetical protein